jgi:hypothetical protein
LRQRKRARALSLVGWLSGRLDVSVRLRNGGCGSGSSLTHWQHKQIQGESAATSRCHTSNSDMGQNEDQMDEATIGDLANLATSTETERGVVETLNEAKAQLAKQLEENDSELR